MSTPILPTVLRGPAIILRDSMAFYVEGDIKYKYVRKTHKVSSDEVGRVRDVMAGGMIEIDFTPAALFKTLGKYYPYGPSSLVAASSVGTSIFGAAAVPCVIHRKAGQTITFTRSGVSKCPPMHLGPGKPGFGGMGISVIGKAAVQVTDAAYWRTVASAAFADATFDPADIFSGLYSAALGERTTPLDAIGARTGFDFECGLSLKDVEDDNVGVCDRFLTEISPKLKFAPNNLTQDQLAELIGLQGSDAMACGESLGRDEEDLVVTGDDLTLTLHNAGCVSADGGFGMGADAVGETEWVPELKFDAGAPLPLFTMALPS